MQSRKTFARHLVIALRLSILATGVLALPQCSAPEAADSEEAQVGSVTNALLQCGGVPCSSQATCLNNPPVCSVPNSGICLSNTCAWSFTANASCPCLENDLRPCALSGGGSGMQICTSNKSHTATFWAACAPCPSCTP